LGGEPPRQIQKELLDLQKFPGLLCQPTWTCDSYDYLLGLASELAGDAQKALDNYLTLWLNYSRSPFTTLARLKLEGAAVQPTSSPTATLPLTSSPTSAGTLVPTVTGTPPTATPTVSGTPPTATPTVTGTPPTATPTVSGTPPTATPSPSPTATSGTAYPPVPTTPYP
jgi:hypothetical protein